MTDITEFDWNNRTWDIIDLPFKDPDFLVAHQIQSFDNLLTDTIPRLIQLNSPIVVRKGKTSDSNAPKYELRFTRVYVSRPVQHTTDTGYQPLYPHEARIRDMTYSAPIFVDYEQTYTFGATVKVEVEQKVPLFKIPVMLGSKYCHLYGKTQAERAALNECIYDRGGYFIVNGSEKVVVAQERPVDNKIMLFKEGASSTHSYIARAEVKSTIDQRFYPIKSCSVLLSKEKTGPKSRSNADHIAGNKLEVVIPHIKPHKSKNGIPLFIAMRALGVISDKEIFEIILGQTDKASTDVINLLIPSAYEASKIITQLDAIQYISQNVGFKAPTEITDAEAITQLKLQYTKDIINREFLSHVGQDNYKKATFLACMTRKLLNAIIDPSLFSDRDHYSNKRVDLTGPLLAQIIRYNFQRLIRDIKQSFVKELEMNRSNDSSIEAIGINHNIRKILQKCTIESRVKYALSTGNWHTTRAHAASESKKGIAQVLQRLSGPGTLAHTRRVQSPLERAGSKHEPPRRYHPTQVGKICPNETPEGQQVGIVKNLAMLCHVTIECSSYPVRWILSKLNIVDICKANPRIVPHSTTIFVNGDLIGITDNEIENHTAKVYKALKMFKLNGTLSKYTSISWFIETNELVINTDGGRYCRPLYIIDQNNRFKMDNFNFKVNDLTWNSLIHGENNSEAITDKSGAMIEFVDTNEDECSLIAIIPQQLIPGRVHTLNPDSSEVIAKMGYKGSSISFIEKNIAKSIGTKNTGESNEDYVHRYLKSKLLEKYHKIWDLIKIKSISDRTNSIATLIVPTDADHEHVRVFATHINKFIYNDFLRYTHCELHPAMWHSVVAQMIPFPDHNQSPRNCYQCLDKNETVLMADGSFRRIADINVGDKVITVDPNTMQRKPATVINQYVKHTDKQIVKLSTISGHTLTCTYDHPILTIETNTPTWKKAGDLSSSDKIAVCPTLTYYEHNNISYTILTPVEKLTNAGISNSLISKHVSELERLQLSPVSFEKLPILARIFGFLATDGHTGVYRQTPQVAFTFGSYSGCNAFLDDVEKLGFSKNKITEVESEVHGTTHHGWQVIYNNAFASLMILLGSSIGKKTETESSMIPDWIKNGSMLVKREYLAGFQGGDGCKIRCNKLKNRNSPNYILNVTMQQKCKKYKDSHILFMKEISTMFSEFGIITKDVYSAKNNKHEDRYDIGVVFDCSRENIINYYEKIGYRYDDYKLLESLPVYGYLKYQQYLIKNINTIKNNIGKLYDSGIKENALIARKLGMSASEVSTYLRTRHTKTRLPNGHISYDEWLSKIKQIDNSVFIEVDKVEKQHNVEIADITIDQDTHSFITGNNICVHNSSMGKQALGIFATNYSVRVDTMANVLTYPQRPLVQTRTTKYTSLDKLPHGFQAIVAIACYSGYNQEDSVLASRRAIECGMFNSIYYRTYTNKLQKHKTANTAQEEFGISKEENTIARRVGTGEHDRYHAIHQATTGSNRGRPIVGTFVREDDILISKYKKTSGGDGKKMLFEDASTLVKEEGVVDLVIPNEQFTNGENSEGYPFIKARVSNLRQPIIGDKLASRSAQKGTIGMIYSPEDMPCTAEGIIPDIIMNPHAIPSRMTIAQLIEAMLGKAAVYSGRTRDATPFTQFNLDDTKQELKMYGFDYNGNEIMYNGQTGEMFEVAIFINPTYYQRLKHMVSDKVHSRDLGPVQLLTRQPAEGRSRDGGLRIGEMERDCFIAHGAATYQKEKMNESSDIFRVYVSKDNGNIVSANPELGIYRNGPEDIYENEEIVPVNMPFAMSLLLNEMKTILIDAVLETD